jgi:CheY-like chemotaxis protein
MTRILVIDDEDDIREVVALSLETTAGFEVLTAGSGAAGIEVAVRERPDAILLDMMMPGLDGVATFERLRAHVETRSIPVVFLTARVQASDQRRVAGFGAAGMISKPFDPMLLVEELCTILGWSSGAGRVQVHEFHVAQFGGTLQQGIQEHQGRRGTAMDEDPLTGTDPGNRGQGIGKTWHGKSSCEKEQWLVWRLISWLRAL